MQKHVSSPSAFALGRDLGPDVRDLQKNMGLSLETQESSFEDVEDIGKNCKDCTRRNKRRNPGQHREKQQHFVRKKPTKLLAPPMRQHLLFWVFCKFLRLLRGLQRGLQLLSCFCKQTCIQNTKKGNNRGPHRPINSSFLTLAKVFESAGFWK